MRAHSPRSVLLLALALALGVTGCASGGGGSSARPAGASSNRIVRAELEAFPQMNASDVVQRLRSSWLRARINIPSAMLYVDGARRGRANAELAYIPASEVEQMEFMSGTNATTRYGSDHQGGAILVTMIR